MPWKETCIMEQRIQFMGDYLKGEWTVTELCRYYGISRPTGYKWIERWKQEGPEGLRERSRAPRHNPQAVSEKIQDMLLQVRGRHPDWGPSKLLAWLTPRHPQVERWPSASTVGELLKRRGLVRTRRLRARSTPTVTGLSEAQRSNDVWCADFKGWFQTKDGQRCDPLTISDLHTRYLICCQILPKPGTEAVQRQFQAAFRQYGMPRVIRTDNGVPFASVAFGGLSRLSVGWIKLGITPQRIAPGKPQQNGAHERMHRTLKDATLRPPSRTPRAQQRRFDDFVEEYNEERPHAALGQHPPGQFYTESLREYPLRTPQPHYDAPLVVRRVRSNGEVKWQGQKIYLSETLIDEWVAFEPQDDNYWRVWFYDYPVTVWDSRHRQFLRPGTRLHKRYREQNTTSCGAEAAASAPQKVVTTEKKV
jgi:transposase InsO family protein